METWYEVMYQTSKIGFAIITRHNWLFNYKNHPFRVLFSHSFKLLQTLKFTYDIPSQWVEPKIDPKILEIVMET